MTEAQMQKNFCRAQLGKYRPRLQAILVTNARGGFPGDQLVASGRIQRQPVFRIQEFENASIIKRQEIAVIVFFGDRPPLLRGRLLRQRHDDRFTVYDNAVKIEDDRAQQVPLLRDRIGAGNESGKVTPGREMALVRVNP